MRARFAAAGLLLSLVAGCAGTNSGTGPLASAQSVDQKSLPQAVTPNVSGNVVTNPGFESGSLSPWTSCGSVSGPNVSTAKANSGSYSALIGSTSSPEVNGTKAVCQTVTVPTGGTLSFYVYEGTNDTIQYVDEEADVLSTSGSKLTQLYSEAKSTGGWVQKSFDLSSYAGQTVQLYFGVKGNGYSKDYVYEYLDDVSLTGSGATATPSPAPSATPSSAPTVTPTGSPTAKASATPSPAPTSTASSTPFACNNNQFLTYQSEFAAGSISADQFVDICGSVTQVLAEKHTSSGNHGYFYVQLPSGYQIEIVSNLDAMAQASTDRPPATWPWVSVGQYVYVQGRYYYDNSSSQGVDWTEDDTSSSWQHVGYVAVCTSSGTSCSKYW